MSPAATTLPEGAHERLADVLHQAGVERRALHPLTDAEPGLGVADAYRIQDALVRRRVAAGEVVIGAKLGFTSAAMRAAMGIEEPNYGWLTSAMVLPGDEVALGDWVHPRIEPEIGFKLGSGLRGPGVDAEAVLAATTTVFPCLEIVDSHFHDYRFRAADNTADNSSAAAIRIGAEVAPEAIDLRLLGVVLEQDGEVVATAAGAAALGDPAAAVAWLVNRLAAVDRGLDPGAIVISGGLTAAAPMRLGNRFEAHFDRLGSVSVQVGEV